MLLSFVDKPILVYFFIKSFSQLLQVRLIFEQIEILIFPYKMISGANIKYTKEKSLSFSLKKTERTISASKFDENITH